MPLFLCRWSNGDCSVVWARNKADAIVELDQVTNPEGYPITQVQTFQVHFTLTDRGEGGSACRHRAGGRARAEPNPARRDADEGATDRART